jgi:hypothetical protein
MMRTFNQMFCCAIALILLSGCAICEPNVERQVIELTREIDPVQHAKDNIKAQFFRFYSLPGVAEIAPGASEFNDCYQSASSLKKRHDLRAATVSYVGEIDWIETFSKKSIREVSQYVETYNSALENLLKSSGWDVCNLIGG